MLLLLCESVCMCTCVFAHDICECRPESRGKIVWSVLSFALPVLETELGHLACCMHFIRPSVFSYFECEIAVRHRIDKQDVLSCYIGWAQTGRPLNLFRMHKSGPECTNVCWSWWTDSTKCMFFSSSLMIWIEPQRKCSEAFFSDNWNLSSCEQIDRH